MKLKELKEKLNNYHPDFDDVEITFNRKPLKIEFDLKEYNTGNDYIEVRLDNTIDSDLTVN
jgi:hypothetical protein